MRKTVIQHCFNLMEKNVFSPDEMNNIRYLCQRLDTIADWEKILKKATRSRFIYWIRSYFPYILEMIMSDIKRPN
jgi:hypothetical protein